MRRHFFSSPVGRLWVGEVLLPRGACVAPVRASVCRGDDTHTSVPAPAWPVQSCWAGAGQEGWCCREQAGACATPSPGAGMSPPPAASPYSPVLPPEEAWGVWRLEGHAGACSPAPASVLPASAQHPGSDAGSAHSRVSPASRAAGTAWVLAASWGCRHGVNTPGR